MNTYNLLAVIPARGGSKRLSKKNIIDFFGKPLIYYSVEAAIESNIFSEIVVSSEDDEILNLVSKLENISLLKRPNYLATDESSVMDVVNHVLDIKDDNYDYVFIILPSTPMRDKRDLKNAYNVLIKKKPNAIISVFESPFPFIYSFYIDEGYLYRYFPKSFVTQSQKAPKCYIDNGGFYALRPDFIRKKNYCPPYTIPYIMPFWKSIDINTKEDLEVAKAFYLYFKDNNKDVDKDINNV